MNLSNDDVYNLRKNGFLLIKNCIPSDRINYAQSCINEKVNYKKLESYFNETMLNTVNKKLNMDLTCIKYRVSNNNNSSDAGSFHRDLQSYETKNEEIPVFTCLSYLDKTHMELITGSHLYSHISLYQIPSFLQNRQVISVNPGDLLIFYATMLHRGIFYEKTPERRLIQLFDCISNTRIDEFKKKILHIPCGNKCSSNVSSLLITLNKIPICSELVNYVGFCTAAKGYGAYYNGLKYITNDKEIKYLSSESNRGRIIPKGGFEQQNMYVMFSENNKDIEESKHDNYLFLTFLIDIVLYFIFIVIFIYFTFTIVKYWIFSRTKRKFFKRKR